MPFFEYHGPEARYFANFRTLVEPGDVVESAMNPDVQLFDELEAGVEPGVVLTDVDHDDPPPDAPEPDRITATEG